MSTMFIWNSKKEADKTYAIALSSLSYRGIIGVCYDWNMFYDRYKSL